jgi:LysM repeat protein
MEQSPQKSNNMINVLVISAILLAFATYLAINMITSRPQPGAGTVTPGTAVPPPPLIINGVPIFRNIDPAKEIILISEQNPPQVPPSDPQGGLPPTATPIPPGPTAIPPPPPTATRDPNPVIFKPYTVVQGDSLYSIAEANNSSIELMAKHGIDDDDLVPGAVLNLPYANPDYCPGTRAYVVRDKDTVFRIAAVFSTTVEAIAALNGLAADYRVEVTQVICIPV